MTDNNSQKKKDDPIAQLIMAMVVSGKEVAPKDVALAYWKEHRKQHDRPDAWRKYLLAVRQQAVYLARGGKIEIVRKGFVADPNDFRGLVKLRTPVPGAPRLPVADDDDDFAEDLDD